MSSTHPKLPTLPTQAMAGMGELKHERSGSQQN